MLAAKSPPNIVVNISDQIGSRSTTTGTPIDVPVATSQPETGTDKANGGRDQLQRDLENDLVKKTLESMKGLPYIGSPINVNKPTD